MRKLLLGAVLGWMTAGAGIGQQSPGFTGVIRGVVIDDAGSHVAGAQVRADSQDGRPRGSVLPFSETDRDGAFAIPRLDWGLYHLWVSKGEGGGRADTFKYRVFHPEIPDISVTLTPGQAAAEVVLEFPRPGKVTWSATDATTGGPVAISMRVFHWPEGDDNAGMRYDEAPGTATTQRNQYWMLAPPDAEVGLSARADGYQVWRYPASVRIKPGDNLVVSIRLQPLAK
jgi:hypothetical protein